MRSAPAVSVRCTSDRPWRCVQTVLPALAAGVAVVWAGMRGEVNAASLTWASVFVALLAGALAWHSSRQPEAVLRWDGQSWSLDERQGLAAVMIDLGGWMLLRFVPHPERGPSARGRMAVRPAWLAVRAPTAGPAWHGLRVALYAWRAGAPDPQLSRPAAPRP